MNHLNLSHRSRLSELLRQAAAALFVVAAASGCASTTHQRVTAQVTAAVDHFLTAFNNLDWPAFQECFAQDATLFNPDIPDAPSVHRLSGRPAIEDSFRRVFEATRKSASGPPYMHIVPQGLVVQGFGKVAVVTFEFSRAANSFGRRTIVFEERGGQWLIVHIHASNISRS